jgi:AraC-like DNA-binding protein
MVTVCLQGCFLLSDKKGCRGFSLFMLLIAAAAVFNLLEESGLLTYEFQITPVFQLLFGPSFYLAARGLSDTKVTLQDTLHGLPAAIYFFNLDAQTIIALGTASRLIYALFTVRTLLNFKVVLESQRSDADEYSFKWLIGALVVIVFLNALELVRLNAQSVISVYVNILGQAITNGLWLVLIMYLVHFLSRQQVAPALENAVAVNSNVDDNNIEHYASLFSAIDEVVRKDSLFRKERLTLSQLSESIGLKTRDISRAINLSQKKSFNGYINDLRVDYVCRIIKAGKPDTLTALAFDAGFSSKAVFNKSFKQVTGQTPSQFRKSYGRA